MHACMHKHHTSHLMLDIPAQIVPVDGDIKYNGDPQSKFEDVLPEMVISRYGDMRYGE